MSGSVHGYFRRDGLIGLSFDDKDIPQNALIEGLAELAGIYQLPITREAATSLRNVLNELLA